MIDFNYSAIYNTTQRCDDDLADHEPEVVTYAKQFLRQVDRAPVHESFNLYSTGWHNQLCEHFVQWLQICRGDQEDEQSMCWPRDLSPEKHAISTVG